MVKKLAVFFLHFAQFQEFDGVKAKASVLKYYDLLLHMMGLDKSLETHRLPHNQAQRHSST